MTACLSRFPRCQWQQIGVACLVCQYKPPMRPDSAFRSPSAPKRLPGKRSFDPDEFDRYATAWKEEGESAIRSAGRKQTKPGSSKVQPPLIPSPNSNELEQYYATAWKKEGGRAIRAVQGESKRSPARRKCSFRFYHHRARLQSRWRTRTTPPNLPPSILFHARRIQAAARRARPSHITRSRSSCPFRVSHKFEPFAGRRLQLEQGGSSGVRLFSW
jgi:hypothetical protein